MSVLTECSLGRIITESHMVFFHWSQEQQLSYMILYLNPSLKINPNKNILGIFVEMFIL